MEMSANIIERIAVLWNGKSSYSKDEMKQEVRILERMHCENRPPTTLGWHVDRAAFYTSIHARFGASVGNFFLSLSTDTEDSPFNELGIRERAVKSGKVPGNKLWGKPSHRPLLKEHDDSEFFASLNALEGQKRKEQKPERKDKKPGDRVQRRPMENPFEDVEESKESDPWKPHSLYDKFMANGNFGMTSDAVKETTEPYQEPNIVFINAVDNPDELEDFDPDDEDEEIENQEDDVDFEEEDLEEENIEQQADYIPPQNKPYDRGGIIEAFDEFVQKSPKYYIYNNVNIDPPKSGEDLPY